MNQKAYAIEEVSTIPLSGRHMVAGESKYEDLLKDLQSLELHKPMKVNFPSAKTPNLYTCLKKKMSARRIKNIRLAVRKNILFAERLF